MMKEEISWHLENWARWKDARGWHHTPASVDPTDTDRRPLPDDVIREASIPVLSGLAGDVDRIVITMYEPWRNALRAFYLGISPSGERISLLTMEQAAKQYLACSPRTYDSWLACGRRTVGDELDAKQWRMADARKRYIQMGVDTSALVAV